MRLGEIEIPVRVRVEMDPRLYQLAYEGARAKLERIESSMADVIQRLREDEDKAPYMAGYGRADIRGMLERIMEDNA